MARRRRARRGGGGWWLLGALAALALWAGFRWTHGSLGGPARPGLVDGAAGLESASRAAPHGDVAEPAVAVPASDRALDSPAPTPSPGPGLAARAAGAPPKPPVHEHLTEDDRKALESVLDRATRN